MARELRDGSESGKRAVLIRMLIGGIVLAALAIIFIVFSRGYINYSNRMDFIARRLEDYPRMQENHLSEMEQMRTLWLTSDYDKMAGMAAFLYDRSSTLSDEAEKLGNITEMLGVAKVSVIPGTGRESAADEAEARGFLK